MEVPGLECFCLPSCLLLASSASQMCLTHSDYVADHARSTVLLSLVQQSQAFCTCSRRSNAAVVDKRTRAAALFW